MLLNLVKVKDEEIRQLKHQLGATDQATESPSRHNASPLRASVKAQPQLEDQLAAMNQETLEEQVKQLI